MSDQLAIHGGTPVREDPFDGPSHDYGDEDVEAAAEVIRSGFTSDKQEAFERAFAGRHGLRHGVTVNSGTSAMHTCVAALNPDPGAEIIVTPWTSGGSIIGLLLQNCVPVFADVDDTFTLDPADVEAKITPRTRAIIAVHLFGNPCDLAPLREIASCHNLVLIEDCAQAHDSEYQGCRVGTLGDIAGYSFGIKHLAAGGGGIVLTNDEDLWSRAVLFRDAALPRPNGPLEGRPYANYFLAPNYKINEMTAAVLLAQLGKLDGYIDRKISSARAIIDSVSDLGVITPQRVRPGDRHTYWVLSFTLDTDQLGCSAFDFAEAVAAEGVPFAGPYIGSGREGPLYRNPFLAKPDLYGDSRFPLDFGRDEPVDYEQVRCPNGEAIMGRGINLLMRPSLTDRDVEDAVAALRKVAEHYLSASGRDAT